MTELVTNTWITIKPGVYPWQGREVMVRYSDGTKGFLKWNGFYWVDPRSNIRQIFDHSGIYPVKFYIYERDPEYPDLIECVL